MRSLALLSLLICTTVARAQEPLTVDDAVRIARANHPNIGANKAQVDAQDARLHEAKAGLAPGLTGSVIYNPQTANFAPTPGFIRALSRAAYATTINGDSVSCAPIDGTGMNFGPGCTKVPPQSPLPADYTLFNYWTAGVGLVWTPWDWGRTLYNWKSQSTNLGAQKLTLAASEQQVVLDVRLAFFATLAAEAAVRVAEDAVKTQQKHLDQARAFYQVGARTKIDVAQAESDVANAELTLARARGGLESSRAQLVASMGIDVWKGWHLVEPPVLDLPVSSTDSLYDEALKSRPEPREFKLRARGFGEAAKSVRGAFLPQLLISGGPSWTGTDFSALTTNFSVAVSLTYPLTGVNPYLVWGQMREAEANQRAMAEQERAVRNSIRFEAASANALVVTAREEMVASAKLLHAARERRDLAEGRYQAGVGSIIELSDAELAYVNAQFQDVQARLDMLQARARIDHALGRTP
jgi:outer membrane protein